MVRFNYRLLVPKDGIRHAQTQDASALNGG